MIAFLLMSLLMLQQTSPLGPANENPYCGTTTTSFPPPQGPVFCQPGTELDESCLEDCQGSFSSLMVGGSDEACEAYDQNHENFVSERLTILSTGYLCNLQASTPAEEQACNRIMNHELRTAIHVVNQQQQQLVVFMKAYGNIATDAFWDCASNCCIPINDYFTQVTYRDISFAGISKPWRVLL